MAPSATASSTSKRKLTPSAGAGNSPTKQPSLLSFLKRPAAATSSVPPSAAAAAAASSFGGKTLTPEERDLERAIANSLRDVGGESTAVVHVDVEAEQREQGREREAKRRKAAAEQKQQAIELIDDDEVREEETARGKAGQQQDFASRDKKPNVGGGKSSAASSSKTTLNSASVSPTKASAPVAGSGKNAFALLMTPQSDILQWSGADAVESNNYTGAGKTRRAARTAPFYKVLEGMPISVDAFRFGEIRGCRAYFLSHFHSDHYVGLSSSWCHGPIYCSAETASLVRSSLAVDPQYVHALPFDEPFLVPGTGGVIVTPISANHCPGSSLFHFYGEQTQHILPPSPGMTHAQLKRGHRSYLHCGDFRACPAHVNHPVVKRHKLDIIYLDTTYCGARYCFPPQPLVIEACGRLVEKLAPLQCTGEDVGLRETGENWRLNPRAAAKAKKEEDETPQREAMQGWLSRASKQENGDEADVKSKTLDLDEQDAWEAAHAEVDGGFHDEAAMLGLGLEDDEDEENGEMPAPRGLQELEQLGDAAASGGRNRVKLEPDGDIFDDEDEKPQINQDEEQLQQDIKPEPYRPLVKRDIFGQVKPASSEPKGRLLCVVGTYTIGKEKIVLSCARALRSKVYCADPRKYAVYAQLDEPELHRRLTRDPLAAAVHVTGLQTINGEALRMHVAAVRKMGGDFERAVGFRPTGWSFKPLPGVDTVNPPIDRVIEGNQSRGFDERGLTPTRDSTSEFSIYGVPYSEHSSFFELTAFALSVDYDRIIATVNVGSPASRAKMNKWFERWKAERKKRNGVPVTPRTDMYF